MPMSFGSSTEYREFLKFSLYRTFRVVPVLLGVLFIVVAALSFTGNLGDRPIWELYFSFLFQILFEPESWQTLDETPVWVALFSPLMASLELAAAALLLGIVIGVPGGIIAAYYYHTKIDYLVTTISYVGMSLPVYWLGYILISSIGRDLRWLAQSQRINPILLEEFLSFQFTHLYLIDSLSAVLLTGRWDFLLSVVGNLILPALTLGAVVQAIIVRTVRSLTLSEFRKDYVRTARSKGLQEQLVVIRHAMKNSLIPTLTIIGLLFGTITVGSVLVENIFSWPGLGSAIVRHGLLLGDHNLVVGGILVVSILFSVINAVTDILYAYLDPRIRYTTTE